MQIELRMVKKLPGDVIGQTSFPTTHRAVIEISAQRAADLKTFGIALFHELMHVWTNIMKTTGASFDLRKEHRFIYALHKPLLDKIHLMRRK